MKSDQNKLLRVLGYLAAAKDLKYIIKLSLPLRVQTYIDATFTSHEDSKSHSGVAVLITGVLVYASSRKQKTFAKSPTESELITLMDNIGLVELLQDFLDFLVQEKIPTPIIYQDSMSVSSKGVA